MMQNKLIDRKRKRKREITCTCLFQCIAFIEYELDTVLHSPSTFPHALLKSHHEKFKTSMDLIETEVYMYMCVLTAHVPHTCTCSLYLHVHVVVVIDVS